VIGSQPQWDQSFREVSLVALQAAALTRRIFLPEAGPDRPVPEQWQLVIALALIDTASPPYEHPAASVESLAIQPSLDREYAHELLFALMSDGLVVADDEDAEDPLRLRLSSRGLGRRARGYRTGQPVPAGLAAEAVARTHPTTDPRHQRRAALNGPLLSHAAAMCSVGRWPRRNPSH
jgi:hypothetical protein